MKRLGSVFLCGALVALGAGVGYAHSSRRPPQIAMGGMMGGGMMGGATSSGGNGATNDKSEALGSYIQSQGLSCMSCHAVAGSGFGPAFTDIAKRYAGQAHAENDLAKSIANGVSGRWQGYPPMAGGLATPSQARQLARLILDLVR